jgi:hypothetical protein
MREYQKFTPFVLFTLFYIISIFPILYLTILLIGKADVILVIFFGIINAIFLARYFKSNILLNLLLGFFVSSFTLCTIYLLWYLGIPSKSFFHIIFYVAASIFICVFLIKNQTKIETIRVNFLVLPIIIILICSFNLKETYPTKMENENLTSVEIKTIDKQKRPTIGDDIEVRIERQPLFGIRESHEIFKTKTNENGTAIIQLSKSNNYLLFISSKENKFQPFDINSEDLKIHKTFVIEE